MINFIKTENNFNKLLRKSMKTADDATFLFISSYDKVCMDIINEIENGNHKLHQKLNVVDSFETPHAFVACHTTQVPCLVSVRRRKKEIDYYLPMIYKKLGVSDS